MVGFFVQFDKAKRPSFCVVRVSNRKTFAQFLRNETQNFSFFAHQFCAKKQQFAQSVAKVISRKFCAIPQFRKNQTVGDGVFLRIQFLKNLVLECLPNGHFYIIDQ